MQVNLIIFRENGSKRSFALAAGVTTIGRKKDCSVRIPLDVVSRRHAEITVEGDSATLRDLGAANGTYINTKRVETEQLEPGDQIMIGPVVFTVQIDGSPADDELVTIRSSYTRGDQSGSGSGAVGTSKHVYMSDDEIDPISEIEAFASSAEQTAIDSEFDPDDPLAD